MPKSTHKPFSITRRLTFLVIAVSLLSLAVHSVAVMWILPTLGKSLSQGIVNNVHITRQLLQVSQDKGTLERLERSGIVARPTPQIMLYEEPQPPFRQVHILVREIRSKLDADIHLQLKVRGTDEFSADFDFQFLAGEQTWSLVIPLPQPPFMGALAPAIILLCTIGSAAAIAMLFGVRQVTQPISMLSQQMGARRHSLSRMETSSKFSTELLDIVNAFNAVVEALQGEKATRRTMLAGLSHDLRTPLARLQLRTELECPEATFRALEPDFIALARIIDQFLVYVQGEAIELDMGKPMPASATAQMVVESFRASGALVTLRRGAYVPVPLPDLALQRILSNLIDNALSHGKAPVEIEMFKTAEGLQIDVFDQGKGIAAEQLGMALRPFGKLPSRSTNLGHSGLGLAIVTQLADQLGGRIVIHQWDGKRSGVGVALEFTEPAAASSVEPGEDSP